MTKRSFVWGAALWSIREYDEPIDIEKVAVVIEVHTDVVVSDDVIRDTLTDLNEMETLNPEGESTT